MKQETRENLNSKIGKKITYGGDNYMVINWDIAEPYLTWEVGTENIIEHTTIIFLLESDNGYQFPTDRILIED